MATDPSEQPASDMAELIATLVARNPAWSPGDVQAKAEALSQLNVEAARAILLDNGDWDGGLEDLSAPAARGIPTWVVRGDPLAGSLLPDAGLTALSALVGADHVITLPGAPHAPQRTHAEPLVAALLIALA
jgi:pimeloyl-ACP methyl ester carboxylesterase